MRRLGSEFECSGVASPGDAGRFNATPLIFYRPIPDRERGFPRMCLMFGLLVASMFVADVFPRGCLSPLCLVVDRTLRWSLLLKERRQGGSKCCMCLSALVCTLSTLAKVIFAVQRAARGRASRGSSTMLSRVVSSQLLR